MSLLQASGARLLAIASILLPAATAQITNIELQVSGNERLPSAAVLAASALRRGTDVTRGDLDQAARGVFDTGLFRSVNYRYSPRAGGGGYTVTLLVVEERAATPVILDLPDFDADQVWREGSVADGLVGPLIPDNELASDYYRRALESVLDRAGFQG